MKFHSFAPRYLLIAVIFLFYISLPSCQAKFLNQIKTTDLTPKFNKLKSNKFIYFKNLKYTLSNNDTLVDIAVKFKIGFFHLTLANPKIDPWVPPPNKTIIIPKEVLIPKEFIKNNTIIINLPEMRLYYFKNKKFFIAPIGIGVKNSLIKIDTYTIVRKKKKPYWYPPPSIRKEDPTLPKIVPPGPDNPMGEYALYLDKGLYAIHGTNKVYSIGRRCTHGCIRLYPEDIKFLFYNVPLKTKVIVYYEPYKLAIQNKKIYIQAYPDMENYIKSPVFYIIKKLDKLINSKKTKYTIDLLKLEKIIEKPNGLIYEIGKVY
ncbi:hypothetical protein DRN73_06035 [Candidatus Pacearchaeota archaeon]|nr:MAG: hypothetical protein DRN73_06035 [Candidatus Pacearchaeota archaeon]